LHILKNFLVKRENISLATFFILFAVIGILVTLQYGESRVEQLMR